MSFLRRYFPRTYLARRNLYRAKTRTALAILTVAVAVVAVGGLGLFGLAFEADQQQNLGNLSTEFTVTGPGGQFGASDDAPSFDQQRLETVRNVVNEHGGDMTVFRAGERGRYTGEIPFRAKGVENPKLVYGDLVQKGTIPDDWQTGAIISQEANEFKISQDERPLKIGDPVTIGGKLQRVTAIAKSPTDDRGQIEYFDGSYALLPIGLVTPEDNNQPYKGVIIDAPTAVEANEISKQLQNDLNGPLRNDQSTQSTFGIGSVEEEAEAIEQQFTSTARFLLAIGGISLIIAGISITNVQLMSARERRQEIGVLRAVGYKQLDVLAIMLIEAVFMGLLAATIGIGLTLGAGAAVNNAFLGDPMAFQPDTLLYLGGAFGFGVLICVLAGIYPAWKASRERPVEALEEG
jgi:ABC-type antimicrobial peptide transport system, permease component